MKIQITKLKTWNNVIDKAEAYAIEAHAKTNHFYDEEKGLPYEFHLRMVYDNGARIIKKYEKKSGELPRKVKYNILAACWLHDTIEDARKTYNDIKGVFGVDITNLVYACTNEKGKVRSEGANEKYYRELRECPNAVFVKIMDRMANFQHSINMKDKGRIAGSIKEFAHFKESLSGGPNANALEEMAWEELTQLYLTQEIILELEPTERIKKITHKSKLLIAQVLVLILSIIGMFYFASDLSTVNSNIGYGVCIATYIVNALVFMNKSVF